jgi:cytochrome c554/c'-like protein
MHPARFALPLALVLAFVLGACHGCRSPAANGDPDGPVGAPTVRLYLLSTLAGAIEPCGCSKDQLGGLDHLAAFVDSQRGEAPHALMLAAGPLFYLDTKIDPKKATQDRAKADAIADTLKLVHLAAWAPGFNDWVEGTDTFAAHARAAGATPLAGGMQAPDVVAGTVVAAGGVKIGVVGVSDPKSRSGQPPEGVRPPAAEAVPGLVAAEVKRLGGEGARVFVALAAMPRGAALRIADAVPELNLLLVGKPGADGDGNTGDAPPELIGSTLVVETANHGQTLAVVDIYLRDSGVGPVKLADAGGVQKAAQVAALSSRIRELENRINDWERGGKVEPKDIAARKADLEKLRAERDALEKEQPAPHGSFFRYRVQEMREELGDQQDAAARILAYYKHVNEHNKTALADLVPLPAAEGTAGYIGVEACTECHQEERDVWNKTPHAHAYKTLVDGFKEYNLECVGCHVTGYGKAGGSTVTHVDKLIDVGCEVCHGPGSLHAKKPDAKGLVVLKPEAKGCVEQCHHPPHVDGFDAVAKMDLVLGPGHGK